VARDCVTENELLADVTELCAEYGLLCHHCSDSRRCAGKGMPDLVIVGVSRTLFVELKSDRGTLSASQTVWKWKLLASGANYALWTPKHLNSGEIDHVLSRL
jgi:hypothetical protein